MSLHNGRAVERIKLTRQRHKTGSMKLMSVSGSFSSFWNLLRRALMMTITEPKASARTCMKTALIFMLASLAASKRND